MNVLPLDRRPHSIDGIITSPKFISWVRKNVDKYNGVQMQFRGMESRTSGAFCTTSGTVLEDRHYALKGLSTSSYFTYCGILWKLQGGWAHQGRPGTGFNWRLSAYFNSKWESSVDLHLPSISHSEAPVSSRSKSSLIKIKSIDCIISDPLYPGITNRLQVLRFPSLPLPRHPAKHPLCSDFPCR